MADKKQGLLKDGTRRRVPMTGGRGGGMPRIIWLGILVSVIGAVLLFRNQGTSVPTGIGENQTVVTAPEIEPAAENEAPPRSGEVDISEQAPALVPEGSLGGQAERPVAPATSPLAEPAAKAVEELPAELRAETPAAKPATGKPAAAVTPGEVGPYVVQIGSFGQAENADQEAARLAGNGFTALVKVGNTSDGSIIYRVQIGYFGSRTEAEAFINQNRSQLAGAIAVHR